MNLFQLLFTYFRLTLYVTVASRLGSNWRKYPKQLHEHQNLKPNRIGFLKIACHHGAQNGMPKKCDLTTGMDKLLSRDDDVLERALDIKVVGRRTRGRLKMAWRRQVDEQIEYAHFRTKCMKHI